MNSAATIPQEGYDIDLLCHRAVRDRYGVQVYLGEPGEAVA